MNFLDKFKNDAGDISGSSDSSLTPNENPPVEGNTSVENPPVDNTPVDTPPVETPVVDNTPVETPPVDNTPVENPPVDPTPTETITYDDNGVLNYLSEKLGKQVTSFEDMYKDPEPVADPFENKPEFKAMYEWSERTGRPINDWVKFQKDYDQMSDLDVAREALLLKYPTLTNDELNLALEQYTPGEDDLDIDISKKSLALKQFATDGRRELNDLRLTFDTPLEGKVAGLTPEQQSDLQLAQQVKQYQAQQAQQNLQYESDINTTVNGMQDISLKLSDDLTIDYKVTSDDKSMLPNYIKNMSHWYNENGSVNHSSVVRDALISANFEKMIQLAYQQGLNAGVESNVKQINNTNLNNNNAPVPNEKTGPKVEGLEKIFGNRTIIRG